jgi:hypothetical protein
MLGPSPGPTCLDRELPVQTGKTAEAVPGHLDLHPREDDRQLDPARFAKLKKKNVKQVE